jgi:hypothetical protein
LTPLIAVKFRRCVSPIRPKPRKATPRVFSLAIAIMLVVDPIRLG